MCRWYFLGLLFGVAFVIALAETLSRKIEKDQRHVREAEEVAATAWDNQDT